MVIRLLTIDDLVPAVELSTLAGWNQTSADWQTLLELAPAGCFCIEVDTIVAATATLITYGARLGWIGMVLTRRDHQRRGCATALIRHILAHADAIGIATLKLDATEQGQPVYERFGFEPEGPIQRHHRPGTSSHITKQLSEGTVCHELDRTCFAADRSGLLNALSRRGSTIAEPDAFAFCRAGLKSAYLGPCVANNPECAKTLICRLLNSEPSAGWYWDILPENTHALALAGEFGFTAQRHLVRMRRGPAIPQNDQLNYGIAGFELG